MMSNSAHVRDLDDAIEHLEEWLYRKGRWAYIWKRVAKYYRAEATRLRGLLVEIHEVVVGEPIQCPSCGVVGCRDDGFCKLAEELKHE